MPGQRRPGPTGHHSQRAQGHGNRVAPGPVGVSPPADAIPDELLLDLATITLDLAGILDPTPASDGASALLSVYRHRWGDALISVVAIVPYVGDLAKAGKLPRYLRTVQRAVERARESARFAARLEPLMVKIDRGLEMMPVGVNATLDSTRALVRGFLAERRGVKLAEELPDISKTFRFRQYESGTHVYKEAGGRLGVPGRVARHRKGSAQAGVSRGSGDDAGHLIGDRFGAPGDARNLSLQNWIANRQGTFRSLEDRWAAMLERGTGVEVRVRDVFQKGQDRPFMRHVEWTEIAPDGARTSHQLDFMNAHTPLSRGRQGVPPTEVPPGGGQVIDRVDPEFWRRGGR